jgi:hypothetical protein
VFETVFLAEHPSPASRGTTPPSLKHQMLVQCIRLTTSSLAFVRLPMLRAEAPPSSPEPSRPPWFHVERRRPLRTETPLVGALQPPSSADGKVSRSRANGELHAAELDRARLGYPPQACLEPALRRPSRARAASLMSRGCEPCDAGVRAWPRIRAGVQRGSEPRPCTGPEQSTAHLL